MTAIAIAIASLIFSKPIVGPNFRGTMDLVEKDKIIRSYADSRLNRQMRYLTVLFLLIFSSNAFVYYVNATSNAESSNLISPPLRALDKQTFLQEVKENKSIVHSSITNQGILTISVINDDRDKKSMASYYCQLAKSKNISVASVKILDASNANFLVEIPSGTVLAIFSCN
ncbi:hypothetical protein [Adhaeribacter radiodurans]|uniref:hypothetical protein n=1 Tax=Adhaeribacter radiodurans TaxID=2745197 RepID=UPI0015F7BB66|nr:hypothetical protein [Adhaeribacter radiodurans]